jgi:hypothetical protein
MPLILHWNGRSWRVSASPVPHGATPLLYGVSTASARDAWAVGTAGGRVLLEHWNGTRWRIAAGPATPAAAELTSVAVLSARDAWAVGDAGPGTLTLHWNGTRWRVVASPQPDPAMGRGLSGISGTSARDVWIAGYYAGGGKGLLARRDGNGWRLAD